MAGSRGRRESRAAVKTEKRRAPTPPKRPRVHIIVGGAPWKLLPTDRHARVALLVVNEDALQER